MSVVGRFRLIVPAATAKPSPKVGQALGPLGINMMNFCKEFNARTGKVRPEVPVQVTIVPRTDRSYKFFLRAPNANWFLARAARQPRGSDWTSGASPTGNVTLKEIYHIAKAKCMDPNMIGVPVYAICHGLIKTARAMGITVTRELLPEFSKRDDVPVERLEELRKELRLKNKVGKKGKK
mmetsp:Transcript_67584/g.175974  ORF Transcript_67584/g.175974 Transcript_67584/m.175974 type:complete len:180 (+) Transcript_67584:112-651(+)